MCNCVKAAINHGYIVCNSFYDENKHDFVDGDEFHIPMYQKNERGKPIKVELKIKHCPICGETI